MFQGIAKGVFESEKERNLYYKFFAGYFFNELIEGYGDRVEAFYELLKKPAYVSPSTPPFQAIPQLENIFVSFDNHPDRFGTVQTGEFADMAIIDKANSILIGVEIKYKDFWDYQKDIVSNESKLQKVAPNIGVDRVIPCLLLSRKRWERGYKLLNHPGSNTKRLLDHPNHISVLLWEDFLTLPIHHSVNVYLAKQLEQIK